MSVERFEHYKTTAFGEQVPKGGLICWGQTCKNPWLHFSV
jgi:hypothetical protein